MNSVKKHINNVVNIIIYQTHSDPALSETGLWKAELTTPRGDIKKITGGCLGNTSNRAVLEAIVQSLQALKFPCIVSMLVQSSYVHKALQMGWVENWAKNNWCKTGKRKPVEHADLWAEFVRLSSIHTVTLLRTPADKTA